ncbi:MAG: Short-chain dehydrogenase [Nocardioidaceae bacterium]|nr:Short-chain dehydrogenase [Nocardioidaceae bacterium]
MSWTPAEIPDLTGRRILVTGVTSGIGAETALELARHGAEVVLAARTPAKLAATHAALAAEVPGAVLHDLLVDVSEMSSVRRAAEEAASLGPLDALVNNAGVMAPPYQRTSDGFALQMATNHHGPLLLTGLLLPQLAASGAGRVVAVSSHGHRLARRAPLGDPRKKPLRYSRWDAYAKSKLADLLFTYELDRRLRAAGSSVIAVAAHPGYSATELAGAGRRTAGEKGRAGILQAAFHAFGQPAAMGAWPTLMATTAPLPGSTYVGPGDVGQLAGPPTIVTSSRRSHDRDAQRRLWEISEDATGISYP